MRYAIIAILCAVLTILQIKLHEDTIDIQHCHKTRLGIMCTTTEADEVISRRFIKWSDL